MLEDHNALNNHLGNTVSMSSKIKDILTQYKPGEIFTNKDIAILLGLDEIGPISGLTSRACDLGAIELVSTNKREYNYTVVDLKKLRVSTKKHGSGGIKGRKIDYKKRKSNVEDVTVNLQHKPEEPVVVFKEYKPIQADRIEELEDFLADSLKDISSKIKDLESTIHTASLEHVPTSKLLEEIKKRLGEK